MQTIVLQPGETREIEGHPAEIKVASEEADERFCVLEATIASGEGPQPHLHRRHVESFYVLDGELEITAGTETLAAPAGSFVIAPPGSPHTFRNAGPGDAHFLGFHAPGGLDRFLAGLAQIRSRPGPPDFQALGELLARHDTEPAEGDVPGAPAARVVPPGEGETLQVGGGTIVIKADSTDTDGLFALVEYTAPAGFPGPPPHRHRETVDMFWVLDGELTMRVEDETVQARPGAFVMVAPGTVHTFSNPSGEPVRYLGIVSPGGFEQYFRELAAAAGDGPIDPAVVRQLIAKYDYEPA